MIGLSESVEADVAAGEAIGSIGRVVDPMVVMPAEEDAVVEVMQWLTVANNVIARTMYTTNKPRLMHSATMPSLRTEAACCWAPATLP